MSAFSAAASDEDGDEIKTLQARVADLEAQLYAVGAGGVGKLEQPQSVTNCHQSQPQGEPPGSTESAYQRGYLDGMAKGRRDAAMDADARVFYDHDTSEVDRYLGFKPTVPLYTHPQPKREPLTDAQINDHRLALPYDGEDLPDPWDFKQGVRAAERAHRIGGEA